MTLQPVFDGHNDILLRMQIAPRRREAIWLTGEGRGHLDLPRMQAGGFAGGMFAIYAAIDARTDKLDRQVLKYKEKVSDHNRDKRIATE